MFRRHRATLVVAAAVAALFLGSPAAEAHGQAALDFTGTLHLPTNPCPPPGPGEQPCMGSLDGAVDGSLSGVHEDVAWEATLGGAPMAAALSYAHLNCAEGFGSGSLSVTASGNQVFGAYHDGTIPRVIVGATISARMSWRTFGTTIAIQLMDGEITLHVFGLDPIVVVTNGTGNGAGAMSLDAITVEGCLNGTGPAADIAVAGALGLAQAGID